MTNKNYLYDNMSILYDNVAKVLSAFNTSKRST